MQENSQFRPDPLDLGFAIGESRLRNAYFDTSRGVIGYGATYGEFSYNRKPLYSGSLNRFLTSHHVQGPNQEAISFGLLGKGFNIR
jgi:hypothetical protein